MITDEKVMHAIIKHAFKGDFKMGTKDCALFSGNVVRSLTGIDYVSEYREAYNNNHGALKRLKELGYSDIVEATSASLNKSPCSALVARSGDVISQDGPEGHALGICLGEYGIFIVKTGLIRVPLQVCTYSWSIS
jgi:hypothetical protein